MTSGLPGKCCFTGFHHEGKPRGEIKSIDNVDTYVVHPQSATPPTKAIVILTDVFGIHNNSQLLADDFADNGYLAVIPDLFQGDRINFEAMMAGKVDLEEWLGRHLSPDIVDPIVKSTVSYVQDVPGIKRIGGAGYCFGAKVRALDVGYNAHPSFVSEEELNGIKGPLSIAAAAHDDIFTKELRHRSEELLEKIGQPYQLHLYGGVSHGFATRCDLSDPIQKHAKEQAFVQALMWFEKYL